MKKKPLIISTLIMSILIIGIFALLFYIVWNAGEEEEVGEEIPEEIPEEMEGEIGFSYSISVNNWELTTKEFLEKNESEPMESPEKYNDIIINKNNIFIRQIFGKPTPCTRVNYSINKKDNRIDIIPKEISSGGTCTLAVAFDEVEINLTLDDGIYTINFYEVWDREQKKPILSKEIMVGIPEEKYCEVDGDCVDVKSGCCGCDTIIVNKNHKQDLNCSGVGCTLHTCTQPVKGKKCIDNTCTFVNWTEAPCSTWLYPFCKEKIPESIWDEKIAGDNDEISCRDVIDLCENFLSEEDLKEIFYNSRCYKEDVGEFGNKTIGFRIFNKVSNATIIKTEDTYETTKGNFTDVNIFWAGGKAGMGLLTPNDYNVIEKQNASVCIVQGGIFGSGFGGTFHGCLEFIDAETGEILAQGWYGYT